MRPQTAGGELQGHTSLAVLALSGRGHALFHPSAWNGISRNFAFTEFLEVELSLTP